MNKHLHEELNGILEQLHQRSEQQEAAAAEQDEAPDAPDEQPAPKVYVYVLDRPLEEHLAEQEQLVDSESVPAAEGEDTPTQAPLPARTKRKPLVVLLVLGLALGGVLCGMLATLLLAPPIATITILPVATPISSTAMVTVVTGVPTQQQVQGRLLSSLMMSQASTVPTTGTGSQEARAASGTVTFYNAALSAQVIPAGTMLTGSDGIQAVTEQDAALPAGTLSTNGQATVTAHATSSGPAGNIRAGDIYGPCCRVNVFVANSAFGRGQDARSFPMVAQQDIAGAVTTLKASLNNSAQAALQAQVRPGESLITPLPCTPTITPDHRAGGEATQVTLTVSETCTAETYDAAALHTLMAERTTQQALHQLGAGYVLTGDIAVTMTSSRLKDAKQGIVTLEVKGAGRWAYQFTEAQLLQMKHQIAGMSKAQATTILLHTPGVRTVSVSMTGNETITLPRDVEALHVVVIYGV